MAQAEAVADGKQASERAAEARFDVVHADAEAMGDHRLALESDAFRAWMAARHEADAAWGAWAVVMDDKPVVPA